jgi:hypothetical protein
MVRPSSLGCRVGHNHYMTNSELGLRLADFQRAIEARDVEAAQSVLDQDYALVLVQPSPVVVTRAQWLATLPDYVVHEWAVQESFVDEDGDCAAVLQRGFQRAVVHGQSRDGMFVISDIWRRRAGLWWIWRRHSTPLAAGAMPTG